jgi:hypothetical protein
MCDAHRTPFGLRFLPFWRITGFEVVPADYPQQLAAIIKAYPSPTPGFECTTWRSFLMQADRLVEQPLSGLLHAP